MNTQQCREIFFFNYGNFVWPILSKTCLLPTPQVKIPEVFACKIAVNNMWSQSCHITMDMDLGNERRYSDSKASRLTTNKKGTGMWPTSLPFLKCLFSGCNAIYVSGNMFILYMSVSPAINRFPAQKDYSSNIHHLGAVAIQGSPRNLLKIKSRETSIVLNPSFGYTKPPDRDIIVFYTKFQNDWATGIDIMDKRDFATFEFEGCPILQLLLCWVGKLT